MMPAFSSWSAFFAMRGYAFYVWLAVSVTLVSLLGLVIHTQWRRHQLVGEIRRQQARAARMLQGRRSAAVATIPSVAASAEAGGLGKNRSAKISGEDAL